MKEELGPQPIRRGETTTPHALVLAPEGAGRTTLTCLSALFVHLDRGATTLVITRDQDASRAWATRLREALVKSSARWNVEVTVAGEVVDRGDMASALLAGSTPAVIVASLEALEAEVLANPRTDPFFARLGLIVAEDVDAFTGVAEMHLHMVMRRVWALLDTVHDAPYPVALVAVSGPSATGMDAWARHVLAAPMRVFDGDGAPRLTRAVVRRRDLADASGNDLPLSLLIEACDSAAIPWHVRRAGDGSRALGRPETELGSLRRHHVHDPADAEVVLIEGTYPEVHREAERLAHAGLRAERKSVVFVLAPPVDEEMVLHEEAHDAANYAIIRDLPRAVGLSEPAIVRQRHFDRALGREQDVSALRDRFGGSLVDEMLDRLEASERIRYRNVWYFDPRADDAATRRLVRATGGAALGEPVHASCVSEATDRVRLIDKGTSEVLLEVDRAVARAFHPPGTVFLHERGRYRVLDSSAGSGSSGGALEKESAIACEQVTQVQRTTPERALEVEPVMLPWSERKLGGEALRVSMGRARVREVFYGVRLYAPGPKLVERRLYDRPVSASYSTETCIVSARLRSEKEPSEQELSDEALVPLTAAMRMMLPCALRGAGALVDVGIATVDSARCIVLFDRTAGGSGFTHYLQETGLGDLLRLARLALERLVGPEAARLHRIHDTSFLDGLPPERWKVREALQWLDAVLDEVPANPVDEAEAVERGRRVEYVEGEGPGDLGRLWISSTGRTDDLVWTRHRWRSVHALRPAAAMRDGAARDGAAAPTEATPTVGPGMVFLDMAVERRTIGYAVRKAIAAGADRAVTPISDPATWSARHRAALATAAEDLRPLIERLQALAGPHYVDTVLALVAAIPTQPRPLPVADRTPLAALARRRADREAKTLLAWAMLPPEVNPTIRLTERGPVLQITRGHQTEVVDLSGTAIRALEGDTGAALALSWGEDETPAAAGDPPADPAD